MWVRRKEGLVSVNEIRSRGQIPAGCMPKALSKLNGLPIVVFDNSYKTTYLLRSSGLSAPSLEETCQYRVDFMWLLEEKPVPDDIRFAGEQRGKVLAKVREKVLESTGRTATINL